MYDKSHIRNKQMYEHTLLYAEQEKFCKYAASLELKYLYCRFAEFPIY